MNCTGCGASIEAGNQYCSNCGKRTGTESPWSLETPPTDGGRYTSGIVADILLSLITCGIYGLFWQARQMRALNHLLREERFSFIKWLLLTLITCGIYHIYYEYLMGQAIMEVQRRMGRPVSSDLPLLSVLLAIFGFSIAADAVQQNEINKFFSRP